MQLLGQPVRHISFGKGIITDISNKIVTIHFAQGEKKFLYPQAFSRYLTLKDDVKQKELDEKNRQRLEVENAAKKIEYEKQQRRIKIRTMKIKPNSQAVFHIDLNEAEKIIEDGSISTGCYLRGASKGKPRIPNRLKPNSVCLLTGLGEKEDERERRILGAFMVNEEFLGEECCDGIVKSHSKYKICLPSDANLSFWNYFKHDEDIPRWGRSVFKYFSNSTMQRILFDMSEILTDTVQKNAVKEFYQYFCSINQLSKNDSL